MYILCSLHSLYSCSWLEVAKPIAHRTIGPEKPHLPQKGGVTKRRVKKTKSTQKSHR